MRIITLHCDFIKFKAVKKAIKEPEQDINKEEQTIKDPLVVLTAVEKGDTENQVNQLVESIKKTASEVKASSIVLYPYAHLSSNLAGPEIALKILKDAESKLKKDLKVTRAPFGYYKTFELKCKGHPLAELSKEFRPDSQDAKEKGIEENYDTEQLLREISRSKLDTSKLKDNDHRILGQKLDLFSFNDVAPGSVFWHHNGQIIYNELVNFSRQIHKEFGYQEISTPQILDNKLWKLSGHWTHYKDNMFITEYEKKQAAVKPMNCPGMMLVYKTKTRSYKDLPLRLFEFGVDHRKELSGVLSGLFRVVRMTQDDAHLFLTKEQIQQEMESLFKIIEIIYKKTFKFNYSFELSTRPEKFMGEKEDWDNAEKALESALKKSKIKYKTNKGDGAFYGPKIDIHIKDSLNRTWQCATIQLDMQMPKRFQITYVDKDNKEKTPLVIHRAIFGSIERFIGILLEHTHGNLPLWLSPIQVRVINFTDRNTKATEKTIFELKKEIPSLRIESDLDSTTLNEKVRDAEIQKIPYIIVIGDKEEKSNTLAVRHRGAKPVFNIKLSSLVKELKDKIEDRS